MTGRTPLQETLLGEDAGSVMAWSLWRQGYERGAQSGYSAGYADGIDALREAAGLLASYETWRQPTRDEVNRRRAEAGERADRRTGPELRADAHASWGLDDTEGVAA